MIRAILFANFGVLTDIVFESFKNKIPDDIYAQIKTINESADIGEIDDTTRNENVTKLLTSINIDGRTEIEQAYSRLRKRTELFDYILELREKYKIGMLSNVSNNIHRLYSAEELDKYFDDAVLSYQVRLTKPDPEIYRLAARRLNVDPANCVLVDDKQSNIDGAAAVGMHGILYTNFDQFRQDLLKILERESA